MSIDTKLLAVLSKRERFDRYRKYVKEYTTMPEAWQLIHDMEEWLTANPTADVVDFDGLLVYMRVMLHPTWKSEQIKVYEAIIENIKKELEEEEEEDSIVSRFVELDYSSRIKDVVDKVFSASGTRGLDKVASLMDEYNSVAESASKDTLFISDNIADIVDMMSVGSGINWRLEDLNYSVGSLHPGDLVIVGKRPEVGGTTFVTSELTYMVPQLPDDKHAVIFNNEESGYKVRARCIQSATKLSSMDIAADPTSAQALYAKELGGHNVDIVHSTGLSTVDIERVLRTGRYGVAAINVLDKVQGFWKMEGVDRFRALAQWARSCADKYDVAIILICQADNTAEGQRYINQSQLYGSKTGVQGEADVQLMIGADSDPGVSDRRWINVVKNKKPISGKMDTALRHAVHEVYFDGEFGRFTTIAYKGKAR